MGKIAYLQELCNKYGDYKVAKGWKGEDGEIRWSKHRSVLECWQSDEGIAFLGQVNNRTGLKGEVRIDIDPPKDEPAELTLKRFNAMCDHLESKNIYEYQGYFSGSRGYHIHFVVLNLFSHPQESEKYRRFFIELADADKCKIVDSSMLTLEFAPNNKTGNPKIPIRGDFTCPFN